MRLLHRSRRMLSCRQVGGVLQDYLDAELDAGRQRQVAEHLNACLRCGLEADVYIRIRFALAFGRIAEELRRGDEDAAIEGLRRFAIALTGSTGEGNERPEERNP